MTTIDPKSSEWRTTAHSVITKLAETNTYIVSDMVVSALEKAGMGLSNYSVLGGVFKRAASAGIIAKTKDTKTGNRRSHSAKTVWQSLVYKKEVTVSTELEAINAMAMNALQFNATTIRLASMVYGHFGDLKKHKQEEVIKEFQNLQDQYVAQNIKILEQLVKTPGER